MLQNRRLLQLVVADSLVLGDQQPAFLTYEWQPDGILGARREVLPVAFVLYSVLHERIENGLAVVKIFVEIDNEVFRQRPLPSSAPSGLLLRSAVA